MFGHEKGAFTGADRRRIGKFEQCNGGTIFLDEIGDMPLSTQGKILRLLQDQRFERIGGNDTITTDVRMVAATNRDLKAWSRSGQFRPDLYYRLSVFTIDLPPLREREDDLSMLAHYYLRRLNRELRREVTQVDAEAITTLRRYDWPGNVRELQSVLMQALLRTHGRVLTSESLPELEVPTTEHDPLPASQLEQFIRGRISAGTTQLHVEAHRELDRLLLSLVLQDTSGNQFRAAQILGVARQTLRTRLKDLGIHISKSVKGGDSMEN
jgi:two-component system nitrogen regulation response regulator GlnG